MFDYSSLPTGVFSVRNRQLQLRLQLIGGLVLPLMAFQGMAQSRSTELNFELLLICMYFSHTCFPLNGLFIVVL